LAVQWFHRTAGIDSIHLAITAVMRLIQLFPRDGIDQSLVDIYNDIGRAEAEHIRDFIILHYPRQPARRTHVETMSGNGSARIACASNAVRGAIERTPGN
jgi:hypothetical protein